MDASRFIRYELRTTDVDAARGFYTEILGDDLWGADVTISRLPDPARARGAPPHWLGHLGVGDFEGAAGRLVALGAERLGPTRSEGSTRYAVVRDPFGAVLSLCSDTGPAPRDRVAWHQLHTRDLEKALCTYATLFGWIATDLVDRGPGQGRYQGFAWDGSRAGSISDSVRFGRIHTQWLFFFRVTNLAAATARIGARGGVVLEPARMPNGDLVVACDDPQGGAFGLLQHAPG